MQTLVYNKETKTVVLYAGSYRRPDQIVITINDISDIRFNGQSGLCISELGEYKLIVPLPQTNIIYT